MYTDPPPFISKCWLYVRSTYDIYENPCTNIVVRLSFTALRCLLF